MTEEMQELGRRAVACKGWRWMPGMRCAFNEYEAWEYERLVGPTEGDGFVQASEVAIPDLADAATVGCLLALVQEAGALIRKLTILPACSSIVVDWPDGRLHQYRGTAYADALVAALEAAP